MTDCDRRHDAELPYLCDAICPCCGEPFERSHPLDDLCAVCLEEADAIDRADELLDAAE